MEDNNQAKKKRKTITAIVACSAVAVILFLCIFSLYHLPERDPVETPVNAENATIPETTIQDIDETNDILSASQEQVSEMLGDLEMQYENASLNGEPYVAQQAGLRLALAYSKAGEPGKAKEFLEALMQNYSYDETFVAKCKEMMKEINP